MPMFVIIIGAIAVLILIYFSFFTGKVPQVSELTDEVPEESVISAEVGAKRVQRKSGKYGAALLHYVTFECGDGQSRELVVTPPIYEALTLGERNDLVYIGGQFLGFGDHGALDDEGMDSTEVLSDDGFTYDDYDESIDAELDIQAPSKDGLTDVDRELMAKFKNREKLPGKTQELNDETEALSSYSARALLEKVTIYPFLKRENEVKRIFERTLREAMGDLLGFDGDSRIGRSADSVVINKNEIRIAITLEENPKPLGSKVKAEFGVND